MKQTQKFAMIWIGLNLLFNAAQAQVSASGNSFQTDLNAYSLAQCLTHLEDKSSKDEGEYWANEIKAKYKKGNFEDIFGKVDKALHEEIKDRPLARPRGPDDAFDVPHADATDCMGAVMSIRVQTAISDNLAPQR